MQMSPSRRRGRVAAAGAGALPEPGELGARPKSADWTPNGEEKVLRMMGGGDKVQRPGGGQVGGESEGFNLISEGGAAAPPAPLACEECLTASLLNMTHMSRRQRPDSGHHRCLQKQLVNKAKPDCLPHTV